MRYKRRSELVSLSCQPFRTKKDLEPVSKSATSFQMSYAFLLTTNRPLQCCAMEHKQSMMIGYGAGWGRSLRTDLG